MKAGNELRAIYGLARPDMKQAWELLCEARGKVGWIDFYFMVLEMQAQTRNGEKYALTSPHSDDFPNQLPG